MKKEAQLHSLIKTDNRVLVYLSPDHKILEFNQEAERVYGLKREEVLGKDYFELFIPEAEWKRVAADIRKVMSGVPTIGFESRIVSNDLRETLLSWNIIRILGEQGIPVGIIASGLDITEIRRHRDDIKAFVKKRNSEINASLKILRSKAVEQKQAEVVLKKTELLKDLTLKPPPTPFIQIDASGKIIFWEQGAELILGWSKQEVVGSLLNETIVPPRFRKNHENSLHQFLTKVEDASFKRMILSALHRNGKEVPVELIIWRVKTGTSYVFNVFVLGITAHKKAEKKEYLAATAINAANEAIVITDIDGTIFSANPAFSRITGYSSEEAIGENPRILKSGRHDQAFYKAMWNDITTKGHWAGEIWNRRKNGEIYPEWLSISAVKDEQGKEIQYIGFFIDITQRKEDEKKLYHRAHYDALTGLPNRTLFNERLLQIIRLTKRNQKKAALLFVDLDKFKQINDSLGHLAGDQILNEAGKRMLDCVREADTVARYSGDEFLVLLSDVSDHEDSAIVAGKIIERLSSPLQVNDREVCIEASIGIAVIPDDGEDVTVLLENADKAMYQAKAVGGNRFYFFNQKKKSLDDALMKGDIRRAIENREFVLHYQPIVDFISSKTIALEALIRWEHPDRGLILPDQFISIAEESDLIGEMGEWVLKEACEQTKRWHDDYRYDGTISVNVSSRQLKDDNFDTIIKQALEETGLQSQHLTLEIGGDLLLEKDDKPISRLEKLKKLGVKIAIDDFGAGYSSLSYLSKYPIDHLKIDKPFIQNVASDPKKISIVRAIVSMGHHLNKKVLAMGVETDLELSFLKGLKCNGGQGYFITKPLSAEGYEAVLKEEMID